MYDFVKFVLPYLKMFSTHISVFLFIVWVVQMKSKHYIKSVENKAKLEFNERQKEIVLYNLANPNHMIQITSGWIKTYNFYLAKRYNTLFLSLVFAYVSFNTTSYYESSTDNFYKLLGISTTLFLTSMSYVQGKSKEQREL